MITAIAGVWFFKRSFYQVKFNKVLPWGSSSASSQSSNDEEASAVTTPGQMNSALVADTDAPNRRTVLIATIEYKIEDWNIKVKIGGLGVMASLMAKNLGHQDLIWVVPCVGDVENPVDAPGEAMSVQILIILTRSRCNTTSFAASLS